MRTSHSRAAFIALCGIAVWPGAPAASAAPADQSDPFTMKCSEFMDLDNAAQERVVKAINPDASSLAVATVRLACATSGLDPDDDPAVVNALNS